MDIDLNEPSIEENECNTEINEPKVGMVFESGEDYALFCFEYAFKIGFELFVRSDRLLSEYKNAGVTRQGTGDKEAQFHMMRRLRFMCKRGGMSQSERSNVTGCTACIDARLSNGETGQMVITRCQLQHNHVTEASDSRLMVGFRTINEYHRKRMMLNDTAGVPITKNFHVLALELGGEDKLTFNKRDIRNAINQERRRIRLTGDGAEMVEYFKKMKAENSEFFYSIRSDDEGRLKDVFWADARCRALAKEFGDAVSFDTTFLSNRYKMPFAPFIGVNHHGTSILLAAALIRHEDIDSFVWVFNRWMECMPKAPSVILTDQDRAIGNAIKKVFPDTPHRLCIWHIMKNLAKHLRPGRDGSVWNDLNSKLKFAVHDSTDDDEFKEAWGAVVSEFGLENNKWINEAYEIRKDWVPAYWRGVFCAGMSSTQRSEQQNRFFKGFVSVETGLRKFIEQFEYALKSKVEEEKMLNLASATKPLKFSSNILLQAVFHKLYTNEKFKEVIDECDSLKHTNATLVNKSDSLLKYEATEKIVKPVFRREHKKFGVEIDMDRDEFRCSCKRFEFRGILCRHIARVIDLENIKHIPEKYILNRWRKDLVRSYEDIGVGYHNPEELKRMKLSVEIATKNEMIAAMAMRDDFAYAIYQETTDVLRKQLEEHVGVRAVESSGIENKSTRVWCRRRLQFRDNNLRNLLRNVIPPAEGTIKDPIHKRGNGRGSKGKQKYTKKRGGGGPSPESSPSNKRNHWSDLGSPSQSGPLNVRDRNSYDVGSSSQLSSPKGSHHVQYYQTPPPVPRSANPWSHVAYSGDSPLD